MKKINVLIVEDGANARKTIRLALSSLDCRFAEAESGEDALRLIKKNAFDIIILDIRLKRIDGIETLRRAKEIRPSLPPVIVVTGYPEISTAVDAGRLEVFDYLQKRPFDGEKLRQTVISAINRKQSFAHTCYKHNVQACLHSFPVQPDTVFVGMPFSLNDIYEHAIKPTLESFSLISWRADEARKTLDIGCKICAALQLCRFAIMDISVPNPNVGIEVGLAYGYGKKVLLLRNRNSPDPPTDLAGMEYAEYSDINSLRRALKDYIAELLR